MDKRIFGWNLLSIRKKVLNVFVEEIMRKCFYQKNRLAWWHWKEIANTKPFNEYESLAKLEGVREENQSRSNFSIKTG